MKFTIILALLLNALQLFSQMSEGVQCLYVSTYSITDMVVMNENKVWVSSAFVKPLALIEDSTVEYFTTLNSPLPSTSVYKLAAEDEQYIWLGTRDGLVRTDGTNWEIYNTSNSGLPNDHVISLHYHNGKTLAGTYKGAAILENGQWNIYNTYNSPFASDTITAIRSVDDVLYIATTGGLSVLKNNEWTNHTVASTGIPMNSIHAIKSHNGDIYFSAGLHRIFRSTRNGFEEIELNFLPNIRYYNYRLDIPFDLDDQGSIYLSAEYLWGVSSTFQYNIVCKYDPDTREYQFYTTPEAQYSHVGVTGNGEYIFTGMLCKITTDDYVQKINLFTNNNVKFLEINNVSAPVTNFGMIYGFEIDNVSYTVPKSSEEYYSPGNATTGTIVISAKDDQGNYYAATGDKYPSYNDFLPGPIDLTGTPINHYWSQAPYSEIWRVNRNEINGFKAYMEGDPKCFFYDTPSSIMDWPGNAEAPYAQQLAPYVDLNDNGIFEPEAGEYPEMKGDEMLWWVYNDLGRNWASWGGIAPMRLEYHASAYAYSCPEIADSLQVLNNTTFYRYKIINRSNRHYKDAYIGLLTDISVYRNTWNAIGTDPENNSLFAYTPLPSSNDTPGTDPMMNVMILNGPEAVPNDGIDNNNNGIIDEPNEKALMTYARRASIYNTYAGWTYCEMPHWNWTDTDTARMHYYFLSGKTSDGSPMRKINAGCGPSSDTSSPVIRHIFDGIPYSGSGWYNYDAGGNEDNRYLLSAGPFNFAPGEEIEFEYAVIFTHDTTGPNGLHTSIATNTRDVMQIKEWYENNSFPDCSKKVDPDQFKIPVQPEVNIYPNPTGDEIYIHYTKEADDAYFLIYDLQGRKRRGQHLDCCGKTRVAISLLEAGTYFLKIIDGENVVVKKFVKVP